MKAEVKRMVDEKAETWQGRVTLEAACAGPIALLERLAESQDWRQCWTEKAAAGHLDNVETVEYVLRTVLGKAGSAGARDLRERLHRAASVLRARPGMEGVLLGVAVLES